MYVEQHAQRDSVRRSSELLSQAHTYLFCPSLCTSSVNLVTGQHRPAVHATDTLSGARVREKEGRMVHQELPASLYHCLHSPTQRTDRCSAQQPHLSALLGEAPRSHDATGGTDASSAHCLYFPTRRTALCCNQSFAPLVCAFSTLSGLLLLSSSDTGPCDRSHLRPFSLFRSSSSTVILQSKCNPRTVIIRSICSPNAVNPRSYCVYLSAPHSFIASCPRLSSSTLHILRAPARRGG